MASMDRRLKLHSLLVDILGSENVYFQTPENFSMKYPCVRYELSNMDIIHADNLNYLGRRQYTVTVIFEDPDSYLPDKFLNELPACQPGRPYVADNLNHAVFSIYW